MKYFILPWTLLISVLLASISTAVAGPYLGLGVGAAFYKADLTGLGGNQLDESSTGTKLYAGYAFNKYFATEAGFYKFMEASASAPGLFNSAEVSMKGFGVYAVGIYPVNRELNLMAKLGALRWNADLRVDNASASSDDTNAAFAVAASFAFTKELLATAEWEFFDSNNPELSMFSAGFRYNFW